MGTRADFYLGKGKTAEWLGSIAWDGYREGISPQILQCQSEAAFRHAVADFLSNRDDATTPDQGWPWPWNDSSISDCHYWFFEGLCWEGRGSKRYGGDVYVPINEPEPDWELIKDAEELATLYELWLGKRDKIEFPDMTAKKNVTLGKRSGVIVI